MVEWPVIDEDSKLEDMADRFESLVEVEKAAQRDLGSNRRTNTWWDLELEESL